jgi:UDP-N-acetyl-D-mannosaminuronate dehydrogenase
MLMVILAIEHQDFKTLDIRKSDQQEVHDVKEVQCKELADSRL